MDGPQSKPETPLDLCYCHFGPIFFCRYHELIISSLCWGHPIRCMGLVYDWPFPLLIPCTPQMAMKLSRPLHITGMSETWHEDYITWAWVQSQGPGGSKLTRDEHSGYGIRCRILSWILCHSPSMCICKPAKITRTKRQRIRFELSHKYRKLLHRKSGFGSSFNVGQSCSTIYVGGLNK